MAEKQAHMLDDNVMPYILFTKSKSIESSEKKRFKRKNWNFKVDQLFQNSTKA